MDKDALKEIIGNLKEVAKDCNLKIEDSSMMDFGIRIYNTGIMNKDGSIRYNKKKDEPATAKQLQTLRNLKIPYSQEITTRDASRLISNRLDRK